jgi:hypothetical protein
MLSVMCKEYIIILLGMFYFCMFTLYTYICFTWTPSCVNAHTFSTTHKLFIWEKNTSIKRSREKWTTHFFIPGTRVLFTWLNRKSQRATIVTQGVHFLNYEIWASGGGEYYDCSTLKCDAVWFDRWEPTFWNNILPPSLTMKIKTIRSSKMFICISETTRRESQEAVIYFLTRFLLMQQAPIWSFSGGCVT